MKALIVLATSFTTLFPSFVIGQSIDFGRDIQPLLAKHCHACHGPTKSKSGLRLDSIAAAIKGGNSGPALIPRNSAKSLVIKAITASGDADIKQMPPRGPRLTKNEINLLTLWIDQGAVAPHDRLVEKGLQRNHWSFQKPIHHAPPQVNNSNWVRNPIDCFILARLEKENIQPSSEADRVTLIRRLTFDLIGLPPTIKQIDEFLADPRSDAYERLVDRLLDSPHYGECWGRHWLDLARYADSNGFNIDAPRSIWKYRDWVIEALNADLPFDQFVIDQIAGDLLPDSTPQIKVATGFQRNTLKNEEGGIDLEQFRVESLVDRVNTTGAVFLGLTVGCAQCHNHKFDPISQQDYYQLLAFYNNADEPTLELPRPEQLQQRGRLRLQIAELRKQLRDIDTTSDSKRLVWEKQLTHAALSKLPSAVRASLDVPEVQRSVLDKELVLAAYRQGDYIRCLIGGLGHPLPVVPASYIRALAIRLAVEKKIDQLRKSEPAVVTTLVMEERSKPRETYIHLGGDFMRKGARVGPDVPAILPPLSGGLKSGRLPNRLDLARWLVDARNPLTSRVVVNRLWLRYFGLGLVETENDFGTQGTPPSHPELLDWLATELVARKWSLKSLHRLIVTSATYRRSSRFRPDLAVVDPRNRLLARQSRLRLEAEVVRDAALATSGLLSCKIGGPSVFPPQPQGVFLQTQIPRDWKPDTGQDRYRRGMYTFFWRSAPYPALAVFDAPDSTTSCTRRNRSNTPLQALTLLNDQAFFEFAQALANRILKDGGRNDGERLRYSFRVSLGRPPSELEHLSLQQLLRQEIADSESDQAYRQIRHSEDSPAKPCHGEQRAWTAVARVVLNLDEFITRE